MVSRRKERLPLPLPVWADPFFPFHVGLVFLGTLEGRGLSLVALFTMYIEDSPRMS